MKKIISVVFYVCLLATSTNLHATLITDFNTISDKLRTIGQALHNYESVYKSLPWEQTSSALNPGPGPNLSWRVALLPFLGEQALYNQFDLTQDWNVGVNATLLGQMPDIFRGPGDAYDSTTTRFAGVAGVGTIFEGPVGVKFGDISDGTSNTLMVGEVFGSGIEWTQALDVDVSVFSSLGTIGGFNSSLGSVVPFVVADGSTCGISSSTGTGILSNLFLINDGAGSPSCATPVSEPVTLTLFSLGLAMVGFRRRKKVI